MTDNQKDAGIILRCNAGVDYSNRTQVEQIYTALIRNNSLTSQIGRKYIDKLKSILIGNNTPTCFLCGNNSNTVICPSCAIMLSNASKPHTNPESSKKPVMPSTEQAQTVMTNSVQSVTPETVPIKEKADENKNIAAVTVHPAEAPVLLDSTVTAAEPPKKRHIVTWIITGIVVILLFNLVRGCVCGGGSGGLFESEIYINAREKAELAVKSKVYGSDCNTESKIIYDNGYDLILAVKYADKKLSLKENYYLCYVHMKYNTSGVYYFGVSKSFMADYDNIPDDIITQLKIEWMIE